MVSPKLGPVDGILGRHEGILVSLGSRVAIKEFQCLRIGPVKEVIENILTHRKFSPKWEATLWHFLDKILEQLPDSLEPSQDILGELLVEPCGTLLKFWSLLGYLQFWGRITLAGDPKTDHNFDHPGAHSTLDPQPP